MKLSFTPPILMHGALGECNMRQSIVLSAVQCVQWNVVDTKWIMAD